MAKISKKTEGEWFTQMHVFPEEGENADKCEHEYPYEVQYNPVTGDRRTVKLNQEQIAEIRRLNGFSSEKIIGEDGEVKDNESN